MIDSSQEDPMSDADDQLDDLEETDELDEGGESAETSSDEAPKGEAKRISDLTSKWQQAEARASKAEKALQARDADKGETDGSNDPAYTALRAELREASLDAVLGEFPELKEFGIDRSLIEGSTRDAMRESAEALVGVIRNVSTKARNKALSDAGVKAEPSGASRKPPVDYAGMSQEDFEKLLNSM